MQLVDDRIPELATEVGALDVILPARDAAELEAAFADDDGALLETAALFEEAGVVDDAAALVEAAPLLEGALVLDTGFALVVVWYEYV